MTCTDHKNGERSVFLAALEQNGPEKREAYLAAACADDPALRRRVEALLCSHQEADALFGKLAPERVAEELATELPGADASGGQGSGPLAFLSPSDKSGSKGKLGTYEVEELIGRGGMGIVVRAFDERLHRSVGIKVMSPALASNEYARRRFIREGRAAAAVRDDHVIGIHGVDEANGLPFLVMEYIVGRSLAQRIEAEGPLPVTDILRIGGQIARGLAAAHAQGLVHRDIKPANILLENGVERVKITDFGLAHAVDDVRATQPGTVIGTPEYMSPEQARGERVDHRSDLFSLGCVLYATCAGRPPFRAESTMAIIRRVCEDTPRPLSEINPDIPNWLIEIIDKLIAKDASARFQSAAEVAELLEHCLAEVQQCGAGVSPASVVGTLRVPSPAQPTSDLRPLTSASHSVLRRWPLAAALLLLLAAGLTLAETTGVTSMTASIIRIVRGDGTLVIEVDDPNIQVLLDGEELVITGAGPKELRLRPGQHELHAVKDGKPVETKLVTITREGRQVVKVTRESALRSGPTMRLVWTDTYLDMGSGGPSPDGNYLSYIDWQTGDLMIRELATGNNRRLTNAARPQGAANSRFSADGRRIAYSWLDKEGRYELRVTGRDGSTPRTLFSGHQAAKQKVEYLQVWDWSPDGEHVLVEFYRRGPGEIVLISASDGAVRVLKTLEDGQAGKMRFSPDGRYIAYSRTPDTFSNRAAHGLFVTCPRDIFLLDANTADETPLVTHWAHDAVLGWSADGSHVVFMSDRTENPGIWVVPIAHKGKGFPRLVKAELGRRVTPIGLTNGGSFFYTVLVNTYNVYTAEIDIQNGQLLSPPVEAFQRVERNNWAPAWSPDGKSLACMSDFGDKQFLYVRSLDSKDVQELRGANLAGYNENSLHWSPDGRALIGAARHDGAWKAVQVDVNNGAVTTLLGPQDRAIIAPRLFPDGKTLFYVRVTDKGRKFIRRDLETGAERELYDTTAVVPWTNLSPDGQQLAFKEAGAVKVMPTSGGEPRELQRGDDPISTIAWTPDGEHLLVQRLNFPIGYLRGKEKEPEGGPKGVLWRVPVDGGQPQKLEIDLPPLQHLRIHPDGRQIAFAVEFGDTDSEIWVLENFLPPLDNSKSAATATSHSKSQFVASAGDVQAVDDGNEIYYFADLQPQANQKLADDFHSYEGNNLKELPQGEQMLEGVRFKVGEAVIQLAGIPVPDAPEKVAIPVNRFFTKLYILHGTAYGAPEDDANSFVADGTLIGEYKIHFDDQTVETIPVVYGQDVRDWWNWDDSKAVTRGTVAWTGDNEAASESGVKLRLYLTRWDNPKPDKQVVSIDYGSKMTNAVPFCVAITMEGK